MSTAVPPQPMAERPLAHAADGGGVICGFALAAGSAPPALPDGTDFGELLRLRQPLWLHFNLADTRARKWIGDCEQLPAAAREVLLGNDPHIRFEFTPPGLAGVLGDLHHDFDADPEGLGVMRLYLDEHCVVSGRAHPLKTLDKLRRELLGGLAVSAPIDWLGHLVQDLAETFDREVLILKDDIEEAEDLILAGRIHEQGIELGRLRRLLARLRRHTNAGRQALLPVLGQLPAWCDEAERGRLYQSVERLHGVVQDLELMQERARLLQDEIAGRLGEATNRNLYVLSIVTTVLLPINLITGIFGMNTGGLPWSHSADGFWWVMLGMTAAVVASLGVLHWRDIL